MKNFLVLSQTPPSDSGRGTRMRIGMAIESLAAIGRVTLLLITQRDLAIYEGVPPKYRDLCRGGVIVIKDAPPAPQSPLSQLLTVEPHLLSNWSHTWCNAPELAQLEPRYDVAWLFRLRQLPVFERLQGLGLARCDRAILDFDDVESRACLRRALLLRRELGKVLFGLELFEHFKLSRAEKRAVRVVERTLVCSEDDRLHVAKITGSQRLSTLPNGIRLAPAEENTTTTNAPPTLLFVGSLDYYPNVEGLKWMALHVLPNLRRKLETPFRFLVVGRNPLQALRDLAATGAFELHADVPEVASYYADADLVVAPIHAGGGTRIKILEAFAMHRAVLSTTLGAEGLGASADEHLAIADTPEDFSDKICRLLDSPATRKQLASNATRFVDANFSLAVIQRRIAELVA